MRESQRWIKQDERWEQGSEKKCSEEKNGPKLSSK